MAKAKDERITVALRLDPEQTRAVRHLSKLSGVRPESVIVVLLAIQTLRMGQLVGTMERARKKTRRAAGSR